MISKNLRMFEWRLGCILASLVLYLLEGLHVCRIIKMLLAPAASVMLTS